MLSSHSEEWGAGADSPPSDEFDKLLPFFDFILREPDEVFIFFVHCLFII